MSELELFSGIAQPLKEETIDFFSATSSQFSSGLSNVRQQSFSSQGTTKSSRSSRNLATPIAGATPDSKNTEQTVATTDSLNSDDNKAASSSDAVSRISITRKLEYDEETGMVKSQPMVQRNNIDNKEHKSEMEQEENPNVEVTLSNDKNTDENEKDTDPPQADSSDQPPKQPSNTTTTQTKRSLLPFFIVGAICLVLGGCAGAIIVRQSDEYQKKNHLDDNVTASSDLPNPKDNSEDEDFPTATPTTAGNPTARPTTLSPTVWLPTTRPTRTPTAVPTRKPTQPPTMTGQAIGRSDRLERIHYELGTSCHPQADQWFLTEDKWGQEAWSNEQKAPNRDQLWMERYVMACFYHQILSENTLSNWLSSQHVCDWASSLEDNAIVNMDCNSETREVTTLEVSELAHVNGTFPSEIGKLTSLERLGFLRPKHLIGTIPSEISRLPLTFFRCIQCSLNGTIPTELGRLDQLTTLYLGDSFDKTRYLTGSIPSHIGRMTLLQALSIRNARLTGVIPSQIVNLWNLTELYLTGNKLLGDIPPLPRNLTKCELAGPTYDGDFPEENCFPNLDDTQCTYWAQNCGGNY